MSDEAYYLNNDLKKAEADRQVLLERINHLVKLEAFQEKEINNLKEENQKLKESLANAERQLKEKKAHFSLDKNLVADE